MDELSPDRIRELVNAEVRRLLGEDERIRQFPCDQRRASDSRSMPLSMDADAVRWCVRERQHWPGKALANEICQEQGIELDRESQSFYARRSQGPSATVAAVPSNSEWTAALNRLAQTSSGV